LLLREADHRLDLTRSLAAKLYDRRNPACSRSILFGSIIACGSGAAKRGVARGRREREGRSARRMPSDEKSRSAQQRTPSRP